MSENAGSSGGSRLPVTFGEKLSFGAPILAVSVLVAFVLVTLVCGYMNAKFEANQTKLEAQNKELAENLNQTKKYLDKKRELVNEKNEPQQNLDEVVKKLVALQRGLEVLASDFGKFVEGQKEMDVLQNKSLADHDRKIAYLEDKLKRLDAMEAAVNVLKTETGNLKVECKVLKGDLTTVREKVEGAK